MRLILASVVFTLLSCVQALAADPAAPIYKLSVSVKPADRYLSVSGSVVLPPNKDALSKLAFQLAAQAKNLQIEVVSPASAAGPNA